MQLIEKSPLVLDYLARLGAKDTYKAKFESLMQAVDAAPAVEAEPVAAGKKAGMPAGKRSGNAAYAVKRNGAHHAAE